LTGFLARIFKASASMMTVGLKGKTKEEAELIFKEFQGLIKGELDPSQCPLLGKLKVFAGICRYPSRVKCAGLAWHTLHEALANSSSVVSTE
jgi:nitrogen fixation NifU-like protein